MVRVCSFARDTAQGMRALHAHRPPIAHRDLKSPNLLLDRDELVKVSDFGLSKASGGLSTRKTCVGSAGTPDWMAPEVLDNEATTEVDFMQSDVFSFGSVLFELLTGQLPWYGLKHIQVARNVADKHLRADSASCEGGYPVPDASVPWRAEMAQLMHHCWQQKPASRPSFEEIEDIIGA